MTLKDAIIRAVKERNGLMMVRIAGILRNRGLNFDDSYKFINNIVPIDLAMFDSLLYEGETFSAGRDL